MAYYTPANGDTQPVFALDVQNGPVAASAATGSSTVDVEQLVDAVAQVANADYTATGILLNPLDWASILKTKTASGPYSVPGSIVIDSNGQVNIAGIPVYQSTEIGRAHV